MDDSQARKFQKDLNGGLVALVLLGVLERSTEEAAHAGVRNVPAVRVGERVFAGERALEQAAECLASAESVPLAGTP